MAFVNKNIYYNGLKQYFGSASAAADLGLGKSLYIILTSEESIETITESEVLAYSSCINTNGALLYGENEALSNSKSGMFTWDGSAGKLTIKQIDYEYTSSLVETSEAATGFAVILASEEDKIISYEDSEGVTTYISKPNLSEAVVLISGQLNNNPMVNINSNFQFSKTDITFNSIN